MSRIFLEKTNRAHEVFIEKLNLHDASDSDFTYWISSAALSLCVSEKNVELKGKLKYTDELVKAVKKGFEQKNLLHDSSEEERDCMTYSTALFTKIIKDKPDDSNTLETSIASVSKESEEEVVQVSTTAKSTKVMVGEDVKCAICRQRTNDQKSYHVLMYFACNV